ncbi:hypothetical protein [Caldicellulosiruptor saccharolyticus]
MAIEVQKSMVTVQAKLIFDSSEDKQKVLDLMRRWSSCMRYAYKRLLERHKRNELKRGLLREIDRVIGILQSSGSESGRLSVPLDGTSAGSRGKNHNPWRVLRVAVVTPLSPDRVLRDMSVLKSFLISGQVGKTCKGASSCFLGQGLWLSQIPPAGAGKA